MDNIIKPIFRNAFYKNDYLDYLFPKVSEKKLHQIVNKNCAIELEEHYELFSKSF